MTREEFFERFDAFAALPGSVEKTRKLILRLAVQGRLLPQNETDEPAQTVIGRLPVLPPPARFDKRSRAQIEGIGAMSVGPSRRRIPIGWSCTPLIQIAKLESGHTPSRTRTDWWGGNIPWVGLVDARLHDGQTIHDTLQHTNEAGLANSAARLLPAGTVCVSRTASVGYVVVLGRPMATSQDFVNWVPTSVVTSDWFRLVFTAEKDGFARFSKGAVHQTIYYPEWLSMYVMLPSLAEQKRIVAKVDELMALCDRLEAQQKDREARHAALAGSSLTRFADATTPANLAFLFHKSYAIPPADLRKSILMLALKGRLVKHNSSEGTGIESIATDQAPDGSPIDTPEIPEHWTWTNLGSVTTRMDSGWSPQCMSEPAGDGSWGVLRTTAVQPLKYVEAENKRLPTNLQPRPEHEVLDGDILFTRAGPMNRVGIVCVARPTRRWLMISDKIIRFHLVDGIDPDFAALALSGGHSQEVIERLKSGMAASQVNVSQPKLRSVPLPVPPLAEQRRIVAKVDQLMALVEELETQLAASRATAAKLLQAIVGELTA